MITSIPVGDFIDAKPGSRHYNAVARAIELNPAVELIGKFRTGPRGRRDCYFERFYRVKCRKGNRHCVILWTDEHGDAVAKCDCEAHYIPQEPTPCVHIAAALIWESQNNGTRRKAPRAKGAVSANRRGAQADKVN